jgi:hypothetical protein
MRQILVLMCLVCFSLTANAQDAKKVWKEIVKPCTISQLQGNKVIFLGLSNNIEVGTLLRPKASQGGYGFASYQNLVTEYAANRNTAKPMPNPIEGGNFISCTGTANSQKNLKASISFLSAVIPFTGDFGAGLSKATITAASVEKAAMYDMDELVMSRIIEALGPNSQVRDALLQRGNGGKPIWYMVSRAFRVEGLRVKLTFKRTVDLAFKAKYTGPLANAGTGELGGGLTANWLNDSTLELVSTAPFYIAAELSHYVKPNQFESTGNRIKFRSVPMFTPKTVSEFFLPPTQDQEWDPEKHGIGDLTEGPRTESGPTQKKPIEIKGERFTLAEFAAYMKNEVVPSLRKQGAWKPNFIVLHHTGIPSIKQRPAGFSKENMPSLARYYGNEGWRSGPHLFIDQNGVWVFSPLVKFGTHSPSWNRVSWGVEQLGDYTKENYNSGPGEKIRDNAIGALAILSVAGNLKAQTLHFHLEDPKTTHKSCPGPSCDKAAVSEKLKNAIKFWQDSWDKIQ